MSQDNNKEIDHDINDTPKESASNSGGSFKGRTNLRSRWGKPRHMTGFGETSATQGAIGEVSLDDIRESLAKEPGPEPEPVRIDTPAPVREPEEPVAEATAPETPEKKQEFTAKREPQADSVEHVSSEDEEPAEHKVVSKDDHRHPRYSDNNATERPRRRNRDEADYKDKSANRRGRNSGTDRKEFKSDTQDERGSKAGHKPETWSPSRDYAEYNKAEKASGETGILSFFKKIAAFFTGNKTGESKQTSTNNERGGKQGNRKNQGGQNRQGGNRQGGNNNRRRGGRNRSDQPRGERQGGERGERAGQNSENRPRRNRGKRGGRNRGSQKNQKADSAGSPSSAE